MSIFSGKRPAVLTSAAIVAAVMVSFWSASISFAQGTTAGGTAPPAAKSKTELLIGNAVSNPDSGQYKDVTDAITAFENRDGNRAQSLLEQAVKNNPGKLPPAEVMLARLLAATNQGPGARAQLELATKIYPKDPEAYMMLAESALADGRITEANALLEQLQPMVSAYNDNPKRKNYFVSHLAANRANVSVARTDWPEAITRIKDWIKADDTSAQAHQQLGRALFKNGDPGSDKEAYTEFQKAVSLDSKSPNPEIIMAGLWEESPKANKHDKATAWVKQAIQLHPKDLLVLMQAAQWALATSTNANTGLKDAEGYAEQAMAADPKSSDAKVLRALIARLNGKLDNAEKLLSDVVSSSPANIAASNQLALVLIETGDATKMNKAQQIAELNMRATTQGNQFSPEVASTYAWVLYKLDHKAEAGELLNKVLQSTRQLSPDVAYYVAKMLQDQGKLDEAMQVLKAATDSPTPFTQRQAAEKLMADVKKQQEEKGKDKDGEKKAPDSK